MVAITGRPGATAFAAFTARVASMRSLIVSMQRTSAPAAARTAICSANAASTASGESVAVGLEQLPRGADRGRHQRAARDGPLHGLDRLPVDARALAVEAVELQAERRPAEGVGGDEVGPGLDVEPRHLLDDLGPLEREPLRRLARGQPALP